MKDEKVWIGKQLIMKLLKSEYPSASTLWYTEDCACIRLGIINAELEMGWFIHELDRVGSIFCSSDGSGRAGSIVQKCTYNGLFANCEFVPKWVGSSRVDGYNCFDGSGWVGLKMSNSELTISLKLLC